MGAKNGAAWASCQTIRRHKRVINEKYYEVWCNGTVRVVTEGCGGDSWVQLVFCRSADAGVASNFEN